jgi:hypothetical protein
VPLYLSVAGVQAEATPIPTPADTADPAVPAGLRMIAVVNNGAWQSALDVSYPETYRRLRRHVAEGVWQDLQLYQLDEQRALALADGQRATMQGQPVPDPGRTGTARNRRA